jgi:hypothetical protein
MIEIHVPEAKNLFDTIDPSPLGQRDLDGRMERFIVDWASEVHQGRELSLLVHIDHPSPSESAESLGEAIRGSFRQRAGATRRRLRQLLARGRISLLIGILFMMLSITIGGVIENLLAGRDLGVLLRESLLIGGWVAMWRPLEIFLYDWWPIRAEARLYDRLGEMPVKLAPRIL